jgi:hypothetical protein
MSCCKSNETICPKTGIILRSYEIKSRIAMAKAAFNKKKNLFTSTLDLNLRKKLVKCYIWRKKICIYRLEYLLDCTACSGSFLPSARVVYTDDECNDGGILDRNEPK